MQLVDVETEWNLKSFNIMGMTVWDSVDVETEWNLKFHGGVVDKIYAMVDVETEWNLKDTFSMNASVVEYG